MNWFSKKVSDEQILSAVGAWMLCCAVGAYNKTLSTNGSLDFDTWFMCCRQGFVARIAKKTGASADRIESVLRKYAADNAHRTYMEVFEAEKTIHPDKPLAAERQAKGEQR